MAKMLGKLIGGFQCECHFDTRRPDWRRRKKKQSDHRRNDWARRIVKRKERNKLRTELRFPD